jgi:MFS family permease
MTRIAVIVALGGFLMGFDASVISGVVGFVETEFALDALELGWVVASLALTSSLAMMVAGPVSDRIGRRATLRIAAALFLLSAVASALAPDYTTLVLARMLGGFGVGAALIIAPMYIAELAPAAARGRLVSINQLNIVVGISAAFFSNYLLLRLGTDPTETLEALGFGAGTWRWMLGVEALPALFYLVALLAVPESPRWLLLRGEREAALEILSGTAGEEEARATLDAVAEEAGAGSPRELLDPRLRLVLAVGVLVAVLQQITGINAVFFYAPMIFEQTGIGTDAAFGQAVLVGLTNLAFTIVAMACIDRLGRRPLLIAGVAGVSASMLLLAACFGSASYALTAEDLAALGDPAVAAALEGAVGTSWASDVEFRAAMAGLLDPGTLAAQEGALLRAAIVVDPTLVLFGILAFVASFAVSLGPVMWVLFSELFPNRVRALAISLAGLINSGVSFGVQLLFPWELATLGASTTFLIYGLFAGAGLILVFRLVPETRGRSLEELEDELAAVATTREVT